MVLYFIKILLILLVIFSFRNLVEQKMELNEKLKSLTLWEDTRNLFNLHETYSPIYDEDLAAEDIFNDKVLNIYKELSDLNKVFIIKTTNFERSGENITKKNEENIDYTYKSTDREALNRLFACRGERDDILIVRRGLLTDTSIANIALFDGKDWFTPKLPLLRGTCRTALIDNGIIKEKDIRPEELSSYSFVRLFNAMIKWGALEFSTGTIYG